jgi:hypothetical protein
MEIAIVFRFKKDRSIKKKLVKKMVSPSTGHGILSFAP